MTTIELSIPLTRVVRCIGIYDADGDGKREEMPSRALWLAPDAALSYGVMADEVVVSDMFRSADSSLVARKAGRGAAAPGRSSHNYGRAIDVDIKATMGRLAMRRKVDLDAWLAARGWWCWRGDHELDREAWHYFYSPDGVDYQRGNAVAWWGAELARLHPLAWHTARRQTALAYLGIYSGQLDGKAGPLTRQALAAFGRAWGASDDRTLAFVEWQRRYTPDLRARLVA
jgi:hypothetical protein